jgi:dolichol-phosphate mannosyltransferase
MLPSVVETSDVPGDGAEEVGTWSQVGASPASGSRVGRSLVVLPTYNERENLRPVVAAVRERGYDVLVVDDSSPDGTGELAERLAARDPGVEVLHRPAKLGLGSAYVAGFRYGLERGYELFVEMDADGSHLPEYLDVIVAAASRSGGMAIGSRYISGGSVQGWPLHRRLLSWGANLYCQMVLGLPVRDTTSGYRCYTRCAIECIGLSNVRSQGYSFQIEMVYRCLQCRLPVVEVPIHFVDRVAGASKVSVSEVHRAVLTVLRLRFAAGDRESATWH